MSKRASYSLLVLVLAVAVCAAAPAPQKITGKHLANGLACEDCHGVSKPEAAASQKACIDCHGDMVDSEWILFREKGHDFEHSPHDSHESPIDCTKCHAAHKPAVLYCNSCHEFENTVP